MKWLIITILLSFVCASQIAAQQQEVPYTLADRDRIIRLEAGQEALRNEMNGLRKEISGFRNEMDGLRNEMDGLRNEMDGLRNEMDAKFETIEVKIQALDAKIDYVFWLLGALFALMLFMLGYMIWDRRTALNPIRMDVEQLKRENENMKTILRTYSEKIPQLREILRNAGIL
jgi:predicted RNase H-like nuclease (RuvC/YqgF family)